MSTFINGRFNSVEKKENLLLNRLLHILLRFDNTSWVITEKNYIFVLFMWQN